jgi:superfamily II DNA or RNA helicase
MHMVKRQTADRRAEIVARLVDADRGEPWIVWCDTDYEADALMRAMQAKGAAVQEVRGSHPLERKESVLDGFAIGAIRVIVTKPAICGHGLNWQHAARMAFVGRTFSYESYYQAVRRSWRFGQKRPVEVHLIVAAGEESIGRVIDRKAGDHSKMKHEMAGAMRRAMAISSATKTAYRPEHEGRLPAWLSAV